MEIIRNIKILSFLLLFLSLGAALYADKKINEVREFDKELLQDLKTSRDYNYYLNNNPKKVNVLEALVRRLISGLMWLMKIPGIGLVFRLFPYLLVVAAIVLILLKIMNLNPSVVFGRNKQIKEETLIVYEEDINKLNIDNLLERAVNSQDYRLAIRYYFLKLLKELSAKEFIQWKIHKSNIDYIYEIKNESLREEFAQLAYDYECVWYGEYAINDHLYKKMAENHKKTIGKL